MTAPGLRRNTIRSGGAVSSPDRSGSTTLIEAGDQKLLIDAGRGSAIRLFQLKIPLGRLDALLLTPAVAANAVGPEPALE